MLKKSLLLISLCLFPSVCFGWWEVGHMTVTTIAYNLLEPEVKERVDHLIGSFAPFFPNSSDFITAACWADDLSQQGTQAFYHWHGSAHPYDPEEILSEDEREKAVNTFEGRDCIWAIEQCKETLENPEASEWAKAFMLRFLIHIIGDIHQPLHCASLYSSKFLEGDHAGTRFTIDWDHQETGRLHSYWDSMCELGTALYDRPLSLEHQAHIERLAQEITTLYPKETLVNELAIEDPKQWHQESYALAQRVVYEGITPGEKPSKEYTARGQEVCKKQIALAGYRLSLLLNKSVKASSSLSLP